MSCMVPSMPPQYICRNSFASIPIKAQLPELTSSENPASADLFFCHWKNTGINMKCFDKVFCSCVDFDSCYWALSQIVVVVPQLWRFGVRYFSRVETNKQKKKKEEERLWEWELFWIHWLYGNGVLWGCSQLTVYKHDLVPWRFTQLFQHCTSESVILPAWIH